MTKCEVYRYPFPTAADYRAVRRQNRRLTAEMSPALVKFLSKSYGGKGYGLRRSGNLWLWDTLCFHMAFYPTAPDKGRIMAWSIKADPRMAEPIVDRIIGVKRA